MALSVDPTFYVVNECIAISSAMRKNARWAQSGVAAIFGSSITDSEDEGLASRLGLRPRNNQLGNNNPLISGFAQLRSEITETDFAQIDTRVLLEPFLEVVRSQATNGYITSLALSSISNFFAYDLITPESPNMRLALRSLVDSVTHCRFEATDQAEDDGVLLKILSLMSDIITGPLGPLLSDNSVCEIIETCLSMACQMRRGDILRRSAEMTMIKLCQSVFQKLKDMPIDDVVDDEGDVTVSVMKDGAGFQGNSISIASSVTPAEGTPDPELVDAPEKTAQPETSSTLDDEPYGIASIREVLRVLISIIDPANYHQYTDSTRILSLKLLTVAFEVGGGFIGERPSLLNPVSTVLAKYLCQLVRLDNAPILQASLRMALTLIHTNTQHLKLQLEFLLSYILTCLSHIPDIPREPGVDAIFYDGVPNTPKLVKPSPTFSSAANTPKTSTSNLLEDSNGRSTPTNLPVTSLKSPELREIMVEFLVNLTRSSRNKGFFTDIFVNYDCDIDRTDLCEDLVGFLCRNAYPDSANWSTASVPPLCLDAILAFVGGLSVRQAQGESSPDDEKEVKVVMDKRSLKKLSIAITDAFNKDAKKGLKLLVDTKFIPDSSPESIANFLKSSGRLNKTVLGEYLTKVSNKEVMDKFVESFDFSNIRLDEALREFLSFFRLPGESALIERIFEKFSNQYCFGKGNTDFIDNEDAAFVLSYAVIMLNTDAYNPQVKRHMTLEDFSRNLRGANNGHDFAPEYLEEIFKAIRSREIVLPDEHDNDETFEYAWRSLMIKQAQAGSFTGPHSSAYDKSVFEICWKPIVTTLSYIFATATDDLVFTRVISGFNQAAKLAVEYDIPGVVDHIIICLSWISTLPAGDLTAPHGNLEVEIMSDDKKTSTSITVSDLSVSVGTDFKAQMATVTLFKIAKSCTDQVNEGWQFLLPSLANLYLYDMVAPPAQAVDRIVRLSRTKPKRKFKRSKSGKESGLLSTLSSYLTGYNDGIQEPTDEEVEATFCALDCISSSEIEAFTEKLIKDTDEKTLQIIIKTLLNCIPNIVQAPSNTKESYYTVISYFLEFASALVLKNEKASDDLVASVGKTISNDFLYNWSMWKEPFLNRCIGLYLALQRRAPKLITMEPILKIDEKTIQAGSHVFIESVLSDKVSDPGQWYLVGISAVKNPQIVYDYIKSGEKKAPVAVWNAICNSTRKPKEDKNEQIALDSINIMFKLEEDKSKAGDETWYEFSKAIAGQIVNVNRKVRTQALNYIEQLLLSPNLVERPGFEWEVGFESLIFPPVKVLLKPETYELDPAGMGSTRLHVASLLCKVFLQYVVYQQQQDSKELSISLWTQILETLDRLMNSSQQDTMKESVVESLKNALLVVKSSQLGDNKFWQETWQRIDKFMPALKREIEDRPQSQEKAEEKQEEKQVNEKEKDETKE